MKVCAHLWVFAGRWTATTLVAAAVSHSKPGECKTPRLGGPPVTQQPAECGVLWWQCALRRVGLCRPLWRRVLCLLERLHLERVQWECVQVLAAEISALAAGGAVDSPRQAR